MITLNITHLLCMHSQQSLHICNIRMLFKNDKYHKQQDQQIYTKATNGFFLKGGCSSDFDLLYLSDDFRRWFFDLFLLLDRLVLKLFVLNGLVVVERLMLVVVIVLRWLVVMSFLMV